MLVVCALASGFFGGSGSPKMDQTQDWGSFPGEEQTFNHRAIKKVYLLSITPKSNNLKQRVFITFQGLWIRNM